MRFIYGWYYNFRSWLSPAWAKEQERLMLERLTEFVKNNPTPMFLYGPTGIGSVPIPDPNDISKKTFEIKLNPLGKEE
jgi:hypothetical protein